MLVSYRQPKPGRASQPASITVARIAPEVAPVRRTQQCRTRPPTSAMVSPAPTRLRPCLSSPRCRNCVSTCAQSAALTSHTCSIQKGPWGWRHRPVGGGRFREPLCVAEWCAGERGGPGAGSASPGLLFRLGRILNGRWCDLSWSGRRVRGRAADTLCPPSRDSRSS